MIYLVIFLSNCCLDFGGGEESIVIVEGGEVCFDKGIALLYDDWVIGCDRYFDIVYCNLFRGLVD